MNYTDRRRHYLANEARRQPVTPRPFFVIDSATPEVLKVEYRRLFWGGMDKEQAAKKLGIKGWWETL